MPISECTKDSKTKRVCHVSLQFAEFDEKDVCNPLNL